MNMIKELSRRCMYNVDEGVACGPVSVTSIDAEIVIEDQENNVFLHAQWVDAAGDDLYFEATRESIYDVYEKLVNCEDEEEFERLISDRDRIEENSIEEDSKYQDYYDELEKMIAAEKAAHNISNEDE